nr:MAG TPA: Sphingomyelin phosphodiesterase [Crassvirales sp.]
MALNIIINKVSVAASFAAGATVATAVASGGTAPYIYSLATGGDKFAINSSTGVVTTIAAMDITNIASFSVTATDSTTGTALTGTSDVIYPPIQAAIRSKFDRTNVIYKITKDIDLGHGVLTIPEGCTLDFQGGSFRNGTIIGNNTKVIDGVYSYLKNIELTGSFKNLQGEELKVPSFKRNIFDERYLKYDKYVGQDGNYINETGAISIEFPLITIGSGFYVLLGGLSVTKDVKYTAKLNPDKNIISTGSLAGTYVKPIAITGKYYLSKENIAYYRITLKRASDTVDVNSTYINYMSIIDQANVATTFYKDKLIVSPEEQYGEGLFDSWRDKALTNIWNNSESSLNFNFILSTDTHSDNNGVSLLNTELTTKFFKLPDIFSQFSLLVNLGDFVTGGDYILKDEYMNSYKRYLNTFTDNKNLKSKTIQVVGNHDKHRELGVNQNNVLTNLEISSILKEYTKQDSDNLYWVSQDIMHKMWIINIDAFDYPLEYNENGTVKYPLTGGDSCYISSSQFAWIIGKINSCPPNYNIIIFSHLYSTNIVTQKLAFLLNEALLKKSGVLTVDYGSAGYTNVPSSIINVPYDFTSINDLSVIGIFTGHTHVDDYQIYDNINIIGTAAQGAGLVAGEYRPFASSVQNCFNIVSIDRINKKIYINRCGYHSIDNDGNKVSYLNVKSLTYL